MNDQKLMINKDRLEKTIEKFADFGRTDNNGVTRLTLSEQDIRVRNYFVSACKEIGMTVKIDDVANIYATMTGIEDCPPFVMGSHLDSVENGGRFDGALGVIAALEIARTLHENQINPKIPFTIIDFTNEEGARFEPDMMCSGVITDKFGKGDILNSTDKNGVTFREALAKSGYVGGIENRLSEALGYLEMHIEQGPILEYESKEIGVVEGVIGKCTYEVEVSGESDHAGTTPIKMRKDAFLTAVEIVTSLCTKFNLIDSELVYTIGRADIYPNYHNIIPNKVIFSVDIRHKYSNVINQAILAINQIPASLNGCTIKTKKLWGRDTVRFNGDLCKRVEKSASKLGYSYKRMYSGAGHDAQNIAFIWPAAMIFVPSVKGKSHCEEEFTYYEDCAKGVNVALNTVLEIIL